jgi:hypothetical protein
VLSWAVGITTGSPAQLVLNGYSKRTTW